MKFLMFAASVASVASMSCKWAQDKCEVEMDPATALEVAKCEGVDLETCAGADGDEAACLAKPGCSVSPVLKTCYPTGSDLCTHLDCGALVATVILGSLGCMNGLNATACSAASAEIAQSMAELEAIFGGALAAEGCASGEEPLDLTCICPAGGTWKPDKAVDAFNGAKCGLAGTMLALGADTCADAKAAVEAKPPKCTCPGEEEVQMDKETCEAAGCEFEDPSQALKYLGGYCCEGMPPPDFQCMCDKGTWNPLALQPITESLGTCGEFATMMSISAGTCPEVKAMATSESPKCEDTSTTLAGVNCQAMEEGACQASSDCEWNDPGVGLSMLSGFCCILSDAEKAADCASAEAIACVSRCDTCVKSMGSEEATDANGDSCDTCQPCLPHLGCMVTAPPTATPGPAWDNGEQASGAAAALPSLAALVVAVLLA